MSRDCFRLEDLGEIAELDPQNPRRAHARDCPRCRALLIAVTEFRDAQTLPPGAYPEEAERALAAALERELAGDDALDPRRAEAASPPWYTRWYRFLGRPVIATGALAALVLLFAMLFSGDEAPHPGVVRDVASAAGATPVILPPVFARDETVTLRWRPAAEADGYQVVFFDLDLRELDQQQTGRDTLLQVDLPTLRAKLPPNEREMLWQVRALRYGDVIGESAPGGFTLP